MLLATEPYADQLSAWPTTGRRILAQYDDASIIVYQAYRPSIARHAIKHGQLGGSEFSYSRMSWIKPNFLWMMYRSGWGTKQDQEVTLALRLRREFFDSLLAQAVESSYSEGHFSSRDAWQRSLAESSVRLQWDPDHDPSGTKLDRRAIQLGLRGQVLEAFGKQELLEVIDLSDFVAEQRTCLSSNNARAIRTPRERVYMPADPALASRLALGQARRA